MLDESNAHARARILVVEDQPAMAAGLRDNLEFEGYLVEIARDGMAGLSTASSGRFDLILLDVMLPKKHGFDVLRDLRRAGLVTPVLMLTAKSEMRDILRGLDGGADDYMTKPFSLPELLARVRALLRRNSAGQAPAHLRLGEAIVDLVRYEVRRGKAVEPLTALEAQLLKLLASEPGKVFSREELLRDVWGDRGADTTRVVDNEICRLRQKIEAEPAEPKFLVTVFGAGYRLRG